jgi:hypothetical protein
LPSRCCRPAVATIERYAAQGLRHQGSSRYRRERIEAAVVAGGKHTEGPREAWISADPFKTGLRVLITGSQDFERTVMLVLDDDPAVIAERVRETLED